MSGRAGRRGLDEKGTVLVFVKDPTKLPPLMKMG
jgi:superfamily II RNA helicase